MPVKSKLFRLAFRLLGSREEAKDLVQEVYIKLWNSREQLGEIQNMEAWCMKVARNLSLDKLKSKQNRVTESIEESFHMQHDSLSPHATAEISESMSKINQWISVLPEKQRQVIHLRDIEGYSYNEICEILELDLNQVKVNLFRARNAVKEKFIKVNAYGL